MSDYNGWTNKETWLVSVWFNPETVEDVEMAKELIESEIEALTSNQGFMCDLINSATHEINWNELKETIGD